MIKGKTNIELNVTLQLSPLIKMKLETLMSDILYRF